MLEKPSRTQEVLYITFNSEAKISSSPPPQEALLLETYVSVPRSCQQAQPRAGMGTGEQCPCAVPGDVLSAGDAVLQKLCSCQQGLLVEAASKHFAVGVLLIHLCWQSAFPDVGMLSGLRLVCEGRRGESPTDKSFPRGSRREKATHYLSAPLFA